MRSSVSVILSSPPPDTTMSYPDYLAHPHHHRSLLVLVTQLGNRVKSRSFQTLFERISRVNVVKVNDSGGAQRPVWVNYSREYPVENNDWGDFQTHRRLLAIITIGQVSSQADLNDVCKQHESLKVKYASTIYDSRCIILGLNSDGSVHQPSIDNKEQEHCKPPSLSKGPFINGGDHIPPMGDRDSGVYDHLSTDCNEERKRTHSDSSTKTNGISSSSSDSGSESTVDCALENNCSNNMHNGVINNPNNNVINKKLVLQPPSYFKTRAMFYPTSEHAVNIESTLQEFISSLFWVVESKRLDKSQEKLDRPPLLCAPFERKDMVGLDLDSRASRKRCVGRLKKQLGDLCLQVGLESEAAQHYSQAADILRACNDWLWLAGCLEGSCAASAVQLYPDLGRNMGSFQRNSSLGVGSSQKHRPTNSLPSNSLPPGLSPSNAKQTGKHCLTPDNLIAKYREAIVHYSKYRNAGVIETEASIKAVYILIEQRKYLLAAEFLSNVVFINLQLTDEEKIGRFRALAELYQELGMMRKAGFFRRVAAMRCAVAQTRESHDWPQCYKLLLNTLPGYRLTLDPLHCINNGGWGALQVQLVQEVVGTSRRMGAQDACVRHQSFLLAALYHHMTPHQRQEAALMLHTLTHQQATENGGHNSLSSVGSDTGSIASIGQSSPTPVSSANHSTPHVNLLNIPLCKSVKVLPPKSGRDLHKKAKAVDNSGPFIFSPFASSLSQANKANNVFDFQWIAGDVCEVVLHFENILNIPLQLSNIKLLTEGNSRMECWASSVVIDSNSSTSVTVRGQPLSPGELKITGYVVTALGVTSSCRLKHIPQLKVSHYIMKVAPAMPLLLVDTETSDLVSESLSLESQTGSWKISGSMVAGERRDCQISLHNSSSESVEQCSIVIKCSNKAEVFTMSDVKLPIKPGTTTKVNLSLYAFADFLAMTYGDAVSEDGGSSVGGLSVPGGSSSFKDSSRSSQAPRLSSRSHSSSGASYFSSMSSKSSSSSSSSHASVLAAASLAKQKPFTSSLEGQVEIWYTGSKQDEWRICKLNLKLQVLPTLQIIRWDVLPGDEADKCYLVLDLLNRYNSGEMELTYTDDGRKILVQAGDTCRVPVPISRCPRNNVEKEDLLSNHVSSQVRLNWQLLPSEVHCSASLPPLSFAPHSHPLMMCAPIGWQVEVNSNPVMVGGEATGAVGDSIHIKVTLTNSSSSPLPPLQLSIHSYQDHQNGNTTNRMEGMVAPAGAMTLSLPQLTEGESCTKTLNLVYFTAGSYKLELKCCPKSSASTSINNTSNASLGHVPLSSNCGTSITTSQSGANSSMTILPSHCLPSPEMWVFAPPIELTVTI